LTVAVSRDEFFQAALNELQAHPRVAALVRAGDPTVLASIGAMAAMLALKSANDEVSAYEPFIKARDATVLADAALKGVLPLGRPCRLRLDAVNAGASQFSLTAGRRFVGSKGRIYVAETGLSLNAGQSGVLDVRQATVRSVQHTVSNPSPFYSIEVPLTDAYAIVSALEVWKGGDQFDYAPDWFNVSPGQLAYQVEVDERRRMHIRMGSVNVIGYGVQAGDVFELRITECEGRLTDHTAGSPVALEYLLATADDGVGFSVDTVLDEGASPLSMDELRVMAEYPAIHDHDAVYLSQFVTLLRRYLTPITFLSVWNEQVEELARGASVNNINKLFVSGSVDGMTNTVFQERVRSLIGRADDSYRVSFVAPVEVAVPCVVDCSVSVIHQVDVVTADIKAALIAAYGKGAVAVSRGMSAPLREKSLAALLEKTVAALQDEKADLRITLSLPVSKLPEHFLYLTSASITVNVSRSTTGNGLWGY
jgi:hypothetical protein